VTRPDLRIEVEEIRGDLAAIQAGVAAILEPDWPHRGVVRTYGTHPYRFVQDDITERLGGKRRFLPSFPARPTNRLLTGWVYKGSMPQGTGPANVVCLRLLKEWSRVERKPVLVLRRLARSSRAGG
jgi:hypothetical protein